MAMQKVKTRLSFEQVAIGHRPCSRQGIADPSQEEDNHIPPSLPPSAA